MQKRREQRWVSHNKVLIGSGSDGTNSKKPHARNPNFDSEETRLLINLWGDPMVQRTLLTIHKKHPVIAKIAEKMQSYGYNRSPEEINTRIKNLKCLYNRIKKDLDSGLLNEPSWRHYGAMDEILSRPVFGNKNIIITNNNATTSSNVPTSSDSDQQQAFPVVKQEEISDEDSHINAGGDENSSMDYEGSELRPEDLLSVVGADNESDVEIKEEPLDVFTVVETKNCDSSLPEAQGILEGSNTSKINLSAAVNRNIINYQNDSSISITSVHSSSTSSPTTRTNNKISLVPTKLLLKSQTAFKSPPPPLVTPTSTITTNAQSKSQSIELPMKVVFVNALSNSTPNAQQNAPKQQLITLNKSQIQSTKVQLVNQLSSNFPLCNEPSNNVSSNNLPNNNAKVSPENKKTKSSKSLLSNNKLPVIRNLLTNIVEIENQRLDIERQRFEYEKKVGNELLSLLKAFMGEVSNSSSETSIQK